MKQYKFKENSVVRKIRTVEYIIQKLSFCQHLQNDYKKYFIMNGEIKMQKNENNIIIYQDEDGVTKISVKLTMKIYG